MTKEIKYSGVIVPMITPFKDDGMVDADAIGQIIANFKKHGVHPFVLGTTGEAPSISQEQKDYLVKKAVKAANGECTVYAGISSNSFAESVEMANNYQQIGVDAVVATLPAFYPMDDDQMLRYFEELADAVNCPLIIYNMPSTVKISIPISVLDKLSQHKNIVGTKDSERDMDRLYASLDLWKNRNDFVHLIGWAAQSATALKNGSDGIVPSTGNFAPAYYSAMYQAVTEGDFEKAEQLQELTNKLGLLYQKDRSLSHSIPALKVIMQEMHLCGDQVLPPMYKMSRIDEDAYRAFIKKEIVKLELIKINE